MPETTATVDAGRLRLAIIRISRELRRHSFAGLTPTQLATLSTVDRCGPVRLGELANAEGVAPSTLTRSVTVLEDHGYLARTSVPTDARSVLVSTTSAGHRLLERLRGESISIIADRMARLTDDNLAALAHALPALERLADAPTDDE